MYIDANNWYGCAMSQSLPYDKIKLDKNVKLEDILNTPNDSEIGYFIECDLKYPDNKEKTKNFPICHENKNSPQDKFSDYMNEMKPNKYTHKKKLISDWTDKKKNLIHYRMLKKYVRHGLINDKVHDLTSFKQRK